MIATRFVAIIQARRSSRRLPDKVLTDIHGRPLLEHVILRTRCCRLVDDVVVATSDREDDMEVAHLAEQMGVRVFRGPLNDVAARFARVLDDVDTDYFVRVSGDSPLIDPALIDCLVERACTGGRDLVTNVAERTYPKGQSIEVVRCSAFRDALELMNTPADREHVTPVLYAHPDRFTLENLRLEPSRGDLQLSVDTPEDLAFVKAIMDAMPKPVINQGLDAILHAADVVRSVGLR